MSVLSQLLPCGSRRIDLACLGRVAVDLYAQQFGAHLEDAHSFAKYLGGSSGNLAFGVARLGLKSAMISRVGDEQMGQFLIDTLAREGCDVSQLKRDPTHLTGLVLLGLKDKDTFPLLFMRENCADMALTTEDIDSKFIAECRALAITGTHLSTATTRAAAHAALQAARTHQVLTVLDIDYRPVLWGLIGRGAGEQRYVSDARVSQTLQTSLPLFDLIVGTEEEFLIAGGVAHDIMASLRAVRNLCNNATLVVKRGALGCCILDGAIPEHLEDAPNFSAPHVEVLNVLGAGDAFLSGLLSSILLGNDWATAMRTANACGALVVSRHACSAAMPTWTELEHWWQNAKEPELAYLHRVSPKRRDWPELCVMAFDHRSQFSELARHAGFSAEAALPLLKQLKNLLVQATAKVEHDLHLQGRIGVLIDGHYGRDALASATGRGWWVGRPVERPGSRPLCFDGTRSIGSHLVHWPLEQVVKCLVFAHPDDEANLRVAQEERLLELVEATQQSGHELLLEIILPRAEFVAAKTATAYPNIDSDAAILRLVRRCYHLGIKPQWWKLAPLQAASWEALAQLIDMHDPYCRGAVILGLNEPLATLAQSFKTATNPIVKGFMVGRSIWATPSLAWLRQELDDDGFIATVTENFASLIQAWQARHVHS